MIAPHTAADARNMIAAYQGEAARARGWAGNLQRQADAENDRARRLEAHVEALKAMLPSLPNAQGAAA